jgi:hypothetical protein
VADVTTLVITIDDTVDIVMDGSEAGTTPLGVTSFTEPAPAPRVRYAPTSPYLHGETPLGWTYDQCLLTFTVAPLAQTWIDNPLDPGADEADFDGYTPPSWDSDDWDAAADGEKETSSLVSLGTPTSDESDRIRYFVLRNESTDQIAFSAALDEKVDIIDGVEVEIRPVLRWVRRS